MLSQASFYRTDTERGLPTVPHGHATAQLTYLCSLLCSEQRGCPFNRQDPKLWHFTSWLLLYILLSSDDCHPVPTEGVCGAFCVVLCSAIVLPCAIAAQELSPQVLHIPCARHTVVLLRVCKQSLHVLGKCWKICIRKEGIQLLIDSK